MSGGPRTRYTLCHIQNGRRYYIPFYNTTSGFLSTLDGVNQTKWFVTYVDGRKLYIPLHYPRVAKSLSTVIDGKCFSFVRVSEYVDSFYPNMTLRFSSRSYKYNPDTTIWEYWIDFNFYDPTGCYDWWTRIELLNKDPQGQWYVSQSQDFTRGTSLRWIYYANPYKLIDNIRIGIRTNYPSDAARMFTIDPNEYNEFQIVVNDLEY